MNDAREHDATPLPLPPSPSPSPPTSSPPVPRVPNPEVVFAWLLVILGAFALFARAMIERPDGVGDAYRLAAAEAKVDPRAIAAFGSPLETRPMLSLNVERGPGYHRVELQLAIRGPRGEGVVRAQLERRLGPWRIESMVLDTATEATAVEVTARGDQRSVERCSISTAAAWACPAAV